MTGLRKSLDLRVEIDTQVEDLAMAITRNERPIRAVRPAPGWTERRSVTWVLEKKKGRVDVFSNTLRLVTLIYYKP